MNYKCMPYTMNYNGGIYMNYKCVPYTMNYIIGSGSTALFL